MERRIKGNNPHEWNLWQAMYHLYTITLHLSAQGYTLKKSYHTPFCCSIEETKARYRVGNADLACIITRRAA
jgi:hypothetical protein